MKKFILPLLLIMSRVLSANNYTDYKEHIASDRFILIFDKNTPTEEQDKLIKTSGSVTDFYHMPAPVIIICFTNNKAAADEYFKALPQVKFVSFFITDGQGHYAGILDDFFVKLTDKNFETLLNDKLKEYNLDRAVPDKYIPNLYRVKNTQSRLYNTIDWCSQFLLLPWVAYAAPNYLFNPLVTSNDPLYNREWNINNTGTAVQGNGTPGADMHVDSAWTITTGSPSIKVAVIDAGVDTLHPDLIPNLLPGHDAIDDSFSTNGYPTPNYSGDGHGTCCAGIVAAVKDNSIGCVGVAPSCKIIPIHVFYYKDLAGNIEPYSTAAAFADAIGWSWDSAGADVLTQSWGLPTYLIYYLPGGTFPVNDALATAHTYGRGGKGTPLFFSSGNDDYTDGPIWPANYEKSIAVCATTMCDTKKTMSPPDCSPENWWGADSGPGTAFAAPGVWITTTDMLGSNGFSTGDYTYTFNGTSSACPNAAAVGALLLSLRPDLTADEVKGLIAENCDKVGGYGYDSLFTYGSWSNELGYGRINAYHAVQAALVFSSIANLNEGVSLSIFPNPAKEAVNIQFSGDKNMVVKIYELSGKEVLGKEIHRGLNTLDVSTLAAGIYIVKGGGEGGIVSKKITIIR